MFVCTHTMTLMLHEIVVKWDTYGSDGIPLFIVGVQSDEKSSG